MLEVKVTPSGEGHSVMVAINGNFKELLVEGLLAIGSIRNGIGECGPAQAAIFNEILLKAVQDKSSPIWTTEQSGYTKIAFDPSLLK